MKYYFCFSVSHPLVSAITLIHLAPLPFCMRKLQLISNLQAEPCSWTTDFNFSNASTAILIITSSFKWKQPNTLVRSLACPIERQAHGVIHQNNSGYNNINTLKTALLENTADKYQHNLVNYQLLWKLIPVQKLR